MLTTFQIKTIRKLRKTILKYSTGMIVEANQEDTFYMSFCLPETDNERTLFAAVRSNGEAIVFYSPIFMEYISYLPYAFYKDISKALDGDGVLWLYRNNDRVVKTIDASLNFFNTNLQTIINEKMKRVRPKDRRTRFLYE